MRVSKPHLHLNREHLKLLIVIHALLHGIRQARRVQELVHHYIVLTNECVGGGTVPHLSFVIILQNTDALRTFWVIPSTARNVLWMLHDATLRSA
jgi:hypothetical protein